MPLWFLRRIRVFSTFVVVVVGVVVRGTGVNGLYGHLHRFIVNLSEGNKTWWLWDGPSARCVCVCMCEEDNKTNVETTRQKSLGLESNFHCDTRKQLSSVTESECVKWENAFPWDV